MFFPIRFKTSVQVAPTDLHEQDFNTVILKKLRKTLEGVCSRYGYIKTGSLSILKRSDGMLMKQHFNGYIYFSVLCRGEVCNPAKDMVIEAKVIKKNALGILAESYVDDEEKKTQKPILDIIIPKKAAGIVSEIEVDEIGIGDMIHVKVIGKRFQLNDTKISIIGKVVRDPNSALPVNEDEGDEGLDDDGGDEDEYQTDDSSAHSSEEEDGDADAEDDEEADEVEGGDEYEEEFVGGGGLDLTDEEDEFDVAAEDQSEDEEPEDDLDGAFSD